MVSCWLNLGIIQGNPSSPMEATSPGKWEGDDGINEEDEVSEAETGAAGDVVALDELDKDGAVVTVVPTSCPSFLPKQKKWKRSLRIPRRRAKIVASSFLN